MCCYVFQAQLFKFPLESLVSAVKHGKGKSNWFIVFDLSESWSKNGIWDVTIHDILSKSINRLILQNVCIIQLLIMVVISFITGKPRKNCRVILTFRELTKTIRVGKTLYSRNKQAQKHITSIMERLSFINKENIKYLQPVVPLY